MKAARALRRQAADAAAVSAEATRAAVDESIRSREQARQHFVQEAAPVITFTSTKPVNHDASWDNFDVVVRNVGRGPALDVHIGHRDTSVSLSQCYCSAVIVTPRTTWSSALATQLLSLPPGLSAPIRIREAPLRWRNFPPR